MERNKLQKILKQELAKGRSPEVLLKMAKKNQIPKEALLQEFTLLAQQSHLPYYQTLRTYLNTTQQPSKPPQENSFWDPVLTQVNPKRFQSDNNRLVEKLDYYLAHPNRPFPNLLLFALPGVLLLLVIPISTLFGFGVGGIMDTLFTFLFFSFVPMFFY